MGAHGDPIFSNMRPSDIELATNNHPPTPSGGGLLDDPLDSEYVNPTRYPGDTWDKFALLALAGTFLAILPSFGLMVSIGTLQEYWQVNQLSDYSTQEVGWIPSVFVYLTLCLGIGAGPLFDHYGARWLLRLGSAGYVLMMFLLAECSKYWHFMLCLALLGGPSGAALTTTSIGLVNRWFKARRGFAIGIAMGGSSFGGIVIPLVLRSALPKYGYAWSIRILAFTFLGCLTAANLCTLKREPSYNPTRNRRLLALHLFREPSFTFLTLGVFGVEVVLFGALGILPTYASTNPAYPVSAGFYLIATLNGASCLGRVLPGFVSDTWGRFNVFALMMMITLVFMLIIWLPFGSSSLAALYVFAALFGFGTGSWMSLAPASLGQLSGPDQFGRYYGTCYFVASLATLIGIPISGQLLESWGARVMVGFMCGVLVLSIAAIVLGRWACVGRKWRLRVIV